MQSLSSPWAPDKRGRTQGARRRWGAWGWASVVVFSACGAPPATLTLPEDPGARARPTEVTPAPDPVAPPGLDRASVRGGELRGYAGLLRDAFIYSTPGIAGKLGRVESNLETPGAYAWRIREDLGEYVAIESLTEIEQEQQCLNTYLDNYDVFERYRLRAYAHRDEFVIAAAREITAEFADGSGMIVAAGTPIEVLDGQAWLHVRGLDVAVPARAQELGLSWGTPGLTGSRPAETLYYEGKVALTLNGQPIDVERLEYPLGTLRAVEPLDDERARWRFYDPCVQLDLVGPRAESQPDAYGVGGLGLVGTGRGGGGARWQIPAKTPALWPDGEDAGQSLTTQLVWTGDVVEIDDRLCFEIAEELTICHARADLTLLP